MIPKSLRNLIKPIGKGLVPSTFHNELLGCCITVRLQEQFWPESQDKFDFVLIGAPMYRDSHITGGNRVPDAVRRFLYKLYRGSYMVKILDLGDLIPTFDYEEDSSRIREILAEIVKAGSIPLILGGGQELTMACYLSVKDLDKFVNLLTVDARLDFEDGEERLTSGNYLGKIIFDPGNKLFDLAVLGYQNYFVSPAMCETMRSLGFEMYRVGDIRADLSEAEPALRNADIVSLDMASVRNSDAPGAIDSTPNGFRAEEICKLARYAGMSQRLQMFGLFNIHPGDSDNLSNNYHITEHLAAQILWHLIDGFYSRINDTGDFKSPEYLTYDISNMEEGYQLRFYKNRKSARWWMSIPILKTDKSKVNEYMIPCSFNDYKQATTGEIPEKWMSAFKKFNI